MSQTAFSAESPQNYEQKSICCFVVDVSLSMEGEPIRELNAGLQEFHQDIAANPVTANRLEVAIVEFCDIVSTQIRPGLIDSFAMPTLTAKGSTKLADGVREAVRVVELRKSWYKQTGQPYLRPWIVLITDGAPDSDQDIAGLAREIQQGVQAKKFVFLAIGVQKADMSILRQISSPDMPPQLLQGLKFSEFFKWVSASMSVVAGSKDKDKVNLPNPAAWTQGFIIS